jgi:hypothetical protein
MEIMLYDVKLADFKPLFLVTEETSSRHKHVPFVHSPLDSWRGAGFRRKKSQQSLGDHGEKKNGKTK